MATKDTQELPGVTAQGGPRPVAPHGDNYGDPKTREEYYRMGTPTKDLRGGADTTGDDSEAQVSARVLALEALNKAKIPYVVAGAYALRQYTGIYRDTKDLDVFCRREDVDSALDAVEECGFSTEVTDPLWLAKGFHPNGEFVDVIFSSGNGVAEVDDHWLARATKGTVLGVESLIAPPEEVIWSKSFVQERERYDGADVQHLIRYCEALDWPHLLRRFEPYPEVLLAHLILFRFSYPGERARVPQAVLDALYEKSNRSAEAHERDLLRGTLLSKVQYRIDLERGMQDARPREVASWKKYKSGQHH